MGDRDGAARETAEAVARRSYGKLVALLASRTRDVAGAEDALADAFASALVDWPANGVPRNPEAWLLTVARRKWIDADRRRRTGEGAGGSPRARGRRDRGGRARRRAAPRRAPRADVRVRASRDRRGGARAADPPDDPRLRRRRDRLGVPRLADDDGPAARAREEEDPRGGHSVPAARARRSRAAPRRGARGDLRRVRGGLVRPGRHRGARPQPRRRGDLARPARRDAPARGGRGARPARADALRAVAPRRAPRRAGRLRAARRAGSRARGTPR